MIDSNYKVICLNYNHIIAILAVILVVFAAGIIFFAVNGQSANDEVVNNTTANLTVETVNTEELSSQSTGSSTHIIMGEDGYYYVVDDYGNFLETLGPSEKYYPNGDPYTGEESVNYPDAEPANLYIDKSR